MPVWWTVYWLEFNVAVVEERMVIQGRGWKIDELLYHHLAPLG